MTTVSLTHTDRRIRDAVLQQLGSDSQLDATAIGVTARNGAVTMTGFIDSYAGKLAAERAAKGVRGVRAVANDIQVTLRLERTDADIAADTAQALLMRETGARVRAGRRPQRPRDVDRGRLHTLPARGG